MTLTLTTHVHPQLLLEFTACWDKDGNGTVTADEFLGYFTDLSVSMLHLSSVTLGQSQ